MPGGVDNRNAGGPGGGEELPGRFQRPPRVLAAGARITPVDFANRAITALIDLVIEIDRQHRGTASDRNFATIGLIDLDDVLIDDVLPAMIFKVAHRSTSSARVPIPYRKNNGRCGKRKGASLRVSSMRKRRSYCAFLATSPSAGSPQR